MQRPLQLGWYRGAFNRIAVDFSVFDLPFDRTEALKRLRAFGIHPVEADLSMTARLRIGETRYQRNALMFEAPIIMNCSGFIKWLFGFSGIWLPRRTVQQQAYAIPILKPPFRAGDLVFRTGPINYYRDDPADNIGHVGLRTENETVIHAIGEHGVVEQSLKDFVGSFQYRGCRRIIPLHGLTILRLPPERINDIETSEDILWLLRTTLPKTEANL